MAELHVSKKTIGKLFSEMQNRKFIIPDYQRPYKWNIEKCETLWDDIENFAEVESKNGSDYFLGTIVSFTNDDKNQEVIDGQQRITSFFLLLRSFYRKLEDMPEDKYVLGLKNQIAPCIWDIDSISQEVEDKTKIHIESLVATEEDNDIFHKILETGNTPVTINDNYSRNYDFFKKKCDKYAADKPLQWKQLCVTIIKNCIVLPIECDTQDTALTIFSTLNDRGMPLADSDIFKARIYKNASTEEDRKAFTQTWKELTQLCKDSDMSIDDVFRYYTHVLRGRAGNKNKEMGLRKFYAQNKYNRLEEPNLMDEIMSLAHFWKVINLGIEPDEEVKYTIALDARMYIDCLTRYPNDYWKYATSVFFIRNRDSESFEEDFTTFLKELLAFLFAEFIQKPTVNAIKDDIYASCISLIARNELDYKIDFDKASIIADLDYHHSSRLSRALLLLDAYLYEDQTTLIPNTFDIEHIFPKKWQDTNYNGWSKEDANDYLDRLGNKIVLEKKINIQAGNGYFGRKKERYQESSIFCVQELSKNKSDDWVKENIIKREEEMKNTIVDFFEENLMLS